MEFFKAVKQFTSIKMQSNCLLLFKYYIPKLRHEAYKFKGQFAIPTRTELQLLFLFEMSVTANWAKHGRQGKQVWKGAKDVL